MPAPEKILDLVRRFRDNLADYRSGRYNETQVRREYIDPFFSVLGWDMDNREGRAEAYKDIVHEDTVKIGGGTKAPDYGFRIGGTRKFFVEAKKPSTNLKDDISPAYQLRRYAWSAKLPLSILTDFEEFAVYDCRIRPVKTDTAATARVMYFTYEEYPERWDEIAEVFSRAALVKGSFDRYADSATKKRGTAEVDQAFLAEIERWRELLARNFALRNPGLDVRDLNFAVQRTIDRLIFLRIGEDRGFEPSDRLRGIADREGVYERFLAFCREADARYNSGLFHFAAEKGRPGFADTLTPTLTLDDRVLQDILKNLYYPDSPYEFSVLPAEILGQVYEQFLGKVIRLTAGGRAKVEDKPEVKKAGGVYYTPTYIVEYIVENTVGKLVEGKTPEEVAGLKILDPACGSGSFLLGAFQYLLEWHLHYYLENEPEKWARADKRRGQPFPALTETANGEWRLTTAEKRRILTDCIFGVDIDPQAVEVTKLSLLLKVLEGENQGTLQQGRLFHERVLPDLDANIKCGNSLIGSDYYTRDGAQRTMFGEEERRRVNAFDWELEFPEIISRGGFDAVIGNPPWGAEFSLTEKQYFGKHYALNTGKYESYIYFIERGFSLLLKRAWFGFIVPSYWISRSQTDKLRARLLEVITGLILFPDNVFTGVKMDCCIILATDNEPRNISVAEIERAVLPTIRTSEDIERNTRRIDKEEWLVQPRYQFNPRITQDILRVFRKVEDNSISLGSLVEISQGLTLYRRSSLAKEFGAKRAEEIVSNRLFHSKFKNDESYKKELLGRDVSRFSVKWNGESWVSYGPWLAHAVDERFFTGPRLVIQKIRNPSLVQRLVVAYLDDDETYSAGVLLNCILRPDSKYSLMYLMGILNSKAINFWYRRNILDVSIRVVDLKQVPIRKINFLVPEEIETYNKLIALVESIVELHAQLSTRLASNEKGLIERQIRVTDRHIDELVYDLYGLTEEEIAIIEQAR